MKISAIFGSMSATPIRPLFKGKVNNQDSKFLFKACPDCKVVNNKDLDVDKFEKR